MSYSFKMTNEAATQALLDLLTDEELEGVAEVSARENTVLLTVFGPQKEIVGYAVFGQDDGGTLAIYYARAMVAGIGKIAMKALFGASEVMGTPLRFHAKDVQNMKAKARMFGGDTSILDEHIDADGKLIGVVNGR